MEHEILGPFAVNRIFRIDEWVLKSYADTISPRAIKLKAKKNLRSMLYRTQAAISHAVYVNAERMELFFFKLCPRPDTCI